MQRKINKITALKKVNLTKIKNAAIQYITAFIGK